MTIKSIIKNMILRFKYKAKISFSSNNNINIILEDYVTISADCTVFCNTIGKYTYIGEHTTIDKNTDSIGRFCSISSNVRIGLGPHPSSFISTHPFCYSPHYNFVTKLEFDEYSNKGYTKIGNDVLISSGAIVLAGVNVGDGAIIGAGAVVIKDVKPYSIVAGVPAKIIKYRFKDDEIKKLIEIKWWEYPDKIIKKYITYYQSIKDLDLLKKLLNEN